MNADNGPFTIAHRLHQPCLSPSSEISENPSHDGSHVLGSVNADNTNPLATKESSHNRCVSIYAVNLSDVDGN